MKKYKKNTQSLIQGDPYYTFFFGTLKNNRKYIFVQIELNSLIDKQRRHFELFSMRLFTGSAMTFGQVLNVYIRRKFKLTVYCTRKMYNKLLPHALTNGVVARFPFIYERVAYDTAYSAHRTNGQFFFFRVGALNPQINFLPFRECGEHQLYIFSTLWVCFNAYINM